MILCFILKFFTQSLHKFVQRQKNLTISNVTFAKYNIMNSILELSVLCIDLASPYSLHYFDTKFRILPVYKLISIILSISFFHFVYLYASKFYPKKQDSRKRESYVSLCHSTFSSILALYILFYRHSLWIPPSSYSDPIEDCDIVFSISYGYFLWDVYISFRYPHPIDFKIHALFCTVIYSFALFTPYLHRPAIIVLLFEISTIFLHSSRIASNYKHTVCERFSNLLFAATFFIFRIIIGSFVTYEMWAIFVFKSVDVDHEQVPQWFYQTVLFINLLFHCLNIYWFIQIIKIAANIDTN